MTALRYFDPLYGRTVLSAEESALVRLPEVQRLRNIRMCNINSFLITGASEISRFEHSLGVLRLAKEWLNVTSATPEDHAILSAAAILHDMKTAPFGHSLEYVFSDTPELLDINHQNIGQGSEQDFFQRTRANVSFMGAQFGGPLTMGKQWPFVVQTIAGMGHLGPLINGSIDLDNIDNVIRLAYHVGLTEPGDIQIPIEITRDLRVELEELSISSFSIPLVKRWQFIRHKLYRFLLHDWAEFSAKAMLTKALELAVTAELIGTDSWILTDDALINLLIASSVGDNQEIGSLLKRISLADLYHPVAILRSVNVDAYKTLSTPSSKRALEARMSEIIKSKCVVHVILDRAKTDRQVRLYIRDKSDRATIGHNSNEILIGLFSSRPQSPRVNARAAIQFRRAIYSSVGECLLLPDPMDDPFDSAKSQLELL